MDLLNRADIVAFLIIIYFTCIGWVQGVVRFLLGFAALFVSGYFTLFYFNETQNILGSLKIFLFLSIAIAIILWAGVNFWNKTITKSKKVHRLSRLLGAIVGFLWSLSLSIAIMVALAILPTNDPFWKKVKKASQESYLYTFVQYRYLSAHPIYQILQNLYDLPPTPQNAALANGKKIEDLRSSAEYQAVYQDFKFQEMLNDKKIKKYLEEKNIAGLVSSPKVQNLLADKEFIEKFQNLYSLILKENR